MKPYDTKYAPNLTVPYYKLLIIWFTYHLSIRLGLNTRRFPQLPRGREIIKLWILEAMPEEVRKGYGLLKRRLPQYLNRHP